MCMLCACQQAESEEPDAAYYVKSRKADGSGEKDNVIEIVVPSKRITLAEELKVTMQLGIGGRGKKVLDGTEKIWLEIEAENCVINSLENYLKKDYEDFFINDIYRPDIVEHYWGYPDKTPNYYEDLEITFPDGECSGRIEFTLYEVVNIDSYDLTTVTLYYAKTDTIIVFSADSETDAYQKLES